MKIENRRMKDIHPYSRNPRKNENAVMAVAESIKQCGYIAPIIIDETGTILAGHTRYRVLCRMGAKECEVVVKEGLTEEQKRKYRLLDNKTSELSSWDFELLDGELEGLDFEGFDFGFIEQDLISDLFENGMREKGPEQDFFSMTFVFPKENKDEIEKFVKTHGKEYISSLVIRGVKNADVR